MTLTPSVLDAERLLKLARAARLRRSSAMAPIEPVERGGVLPLSFAQQRLWFLEQLGGLGDTYHVPTLLRLGREVDRAALRRALDAMVARHEALRTTFVEVGGEPVQRIAPVEESRFHLLEHDLGEHPDGVAELHRLAADEAGAPFDLEHGPLIRGRLVRLSADSVLLLTMHHIVSDGWSMGVLTRELGTLYAAFRRGEANPLPPLPIQYADYAIWQRKWVDGEVLRQQAEYWKKTLSGAPELLELPTDRPRPARQGHAGGLVGIDLGDELTAGLKALGQRHGTTLFMTLLAGWAAVLGRLSGQHDVVVGTPSANRGRAEIDGLIGFFINTLALRVHLSGASTVADLLGQVRARTLGAQQNQDIPFEQVVELVQPARSLAHTPLFQVMFAWQNASGGRPEPSGPGPEGSGVGSASQATAKFDLLLALGEAGGRIVGSVVYAAALFEQATIARHLVYLRRVLEAMAADDRQAVNTLPLLPESERRLVLEEWNRTQAEYPRELCIHELFEAQAERAPGAPAVVFGEKALTYAELNACANRLAHRLRALGVGPDTRVAICVDRGVEMMVGLLAIMKAGGAYVPLDPAYPAERLEYMLADSAPAVLLTQGSLAGLFDGADVRVIDLVVDAGTWAGEPETNPGRSGTGLTPDHLAYVIYTSGSTGQPKGVMVEHRSLANLVAWHRAAFGVKAGDRSSSVAGFGFDATTWEVWPPLCAGAALLLPATRDPQALLEWWEAQALDVSFLPTPLAEVAFARGRASAGLRTLLIGGDRLRSVPSGPLPFTLVNNYGPTETTVVATSGQVGASAQVHIGRPIANTRAYLLDGAGQPVPEGVAGEMYVGGAGVARGYLGRPGLTAERFVPDSFGGEPGARLYRTGDLARWREESASVRECVSAEVGSEPADSRTHALAHSRTPVLEFLGRTDFQVKVRGFRIELGEIEARLSEHPAVRDAVVLARQDASGDPRLVGYYVGEALEVEALRAHLSERLPGYMVPAAYVWMEAYPLTPNGKVDRRALPAPEGGAFVTHEYEAPVGETEQALAEIWAEVLRVERVGRHDHFFEMGGHSLLAVRVISRVRQMLGVEVAIADLFERPVLADLSRAIVNAARTELPPIEPVERGADLPLSFAQQRLWFLEQLGGLGDTYHIPTRLRFGGGVDRAALRRALDAMLARHEALRTTFVEVEGEPVQRIAPVEESRFHLLEHDLGEHSDGVAELQRLAAEELGAPFDLEHGPLIRGRLVRMAGDEHVLLVTMHHVVSDGWSMEVLTRELGTLYTAFRRGAESPLPPLPIQYADYAAWQRKWVDGEVLRQQAEYWTETLSGAPELLELPTDRPRPAHQSHAGAAASVELDEALTAGLRSLGRRHGTTLFMTVLAGWAAVLGRLSGQRDVVVGTPSANRGRTEIEGLIGFFINTLALRVDLVGSPTVAQLLEQVRTRSLGAQQNQDIPFEQVVELVQPARSLAHTPLFQTTVTWHNASEDRRELPGPRRTGVGAPSPATAKFDLSLSLGEVGGRIAGSVTYATALFEHATVERWLGYLQRVLEQMVANDARAVDRLQLLDGAERRLVLEEWNHTEAELPRTCVHERFEAQVARMPDAVALSFADRSLTYAELNARANRLAHHLRGRGVGPDVRVAVCIERSPELMTAFLAVLKAGGAYVPLDPGDPEDRLRHMLDDGAPAALLVHAATAARFAGEAIPVIDLDADAQGWAGESAANPTREDTGLTPGHLAYVIYTSGSTGRPKGVMVEHRALANVMGWMGEAWPLVPGDVVLQKTPVSFDASARELFPPLLAGARMVIARPGGHRDPAYLVETIRREGVTTLHFVPTMLQFLLEEPGIERCTSIARVVCGGEALPAALARRAAELLPNAELHNVYGPTEAAVDVSWLRCPAEVAGPHVSIGRPMANCRAYFLDRTGEPVPAGVAGELYLGGAQVARGYLGRAALTAERFVPDAFGGEPGARLYRTGDLGRWLADGTIDFLGRNDFQVKVRGFRIELGEIEAGLREHEGIREAVVVAREDGAGDRRLVAYWVGDAVEIDALRAHLSGRLAEHMVPAAFVRLQAMPLTSNGKLDRRALPAPEGDAFATRGYEAPVGETEQALAQIWSRLLGVGQVGRRDHFFELGGHSLLAVRVISRVRQVLGVEVALGELFRSPVLADLSRTIQDAARTELPPIERADRGARLPLSFAQARLWFLEQLDDLGDTYHIPTRLRLQGELDRGALVRTLDRIVERHEALRTTFVEVDGEPVQRIAEESRFHLLEHDLGGHADAEAELRRLAADEAGAPFDLEHGPLVRGRLVRMAEDDHVLLITLHHIVSDGWSRGVLTRELAALYGAFRRGDPDPLPPLPVQYADYAAWQRKWVEGDVLQAQTEYWTTTLSGAPELLELPTDRPRPARQDHAGGVVGVDLGEELTGGLKALGQRHGTTPFMTLLAAWAALLARLSGQDDVVVGTPSANRGRAEIEGLIGFFINTLAVRVDLSGSPAVAELLRRVKERALGAQQNQDIPFEQVVELVQPVRSMAHSPLFQVMFSWQNASEGRLELPGLRLGGVGSASSQVTAKFDLSLSLWEAHGRIVGAVEYATALFDRETVERHLAYLRRVLEGMAAADLQAVDTLPLLPESERRLVLEKWSATGAADPSEVCIHALFEAQVRRTPEGVALVHADEALTYAELDGRANRLAHYLRRQGVGLEARVGVFLEWSPELVVALLATLKAGGVYVPLDPSLPGERLAYMTEDAGAVALVTRAALAGRVAAGVTVRVDADAERIAAERGDAPAWGAAPESLAYLIYTSGSTGRPKGVAVEHRAAAAHFRAMAGTLGIVREDRILQFASSGFDVSLEQVFLPLVTGAALVLRGAELWSPAEFSQRVRSLGVTVANLPPAYWQEVLATGALPDVRLLLVGGDALPAAAAVAGAATRLLNCYGPTETVVTATAFVVPDGFAEGFAGSTAPIGRPLPGRNTYVLDARGAPVPPGVAGELYLGGLLARGYLGRPALTAERFVPDPFSAEPGARLYRTGDRVRWLADGTIEYLGRADFQVKVRGFRIELGEIEARLREHAAVHEAVVVAREDVPGDRRLVAYIVGPGPVESDALRAHLSGRLPEYMLPAAYVHLEALPLTPSGKVDRRALPAPEGGAFVTRGYEAPASETEAALAEIWSEVLGVERVGRHDHFFELGGHSLLAVRVISRVRQVLEVEVALGELFTRPVLADFARGLEARSRAELPPIELADRRADLPLSFAQQRLWFIDHLEGAGAAYHMSTRLRLQGELDRAALARALDRIVARHETLRTVFAETDGNPVQRIAPAEASSFHLVEHDLRGHAHAGAELRRVMAEEAGAPFDLAHGPLIRGRLVRVVDDDHVLLITLHHIVSDGWSMGVLTHEISALYAAFRAGEPDPLPPLPVQYADYAAWQRKWVDGEVLRRQAEYWKETLAGAPELLELPTDHARPARQDFSGGALGIELSAELTAALGALARRNGTTLFMTVLAGWATVLSRLSGQEDVVLGTPSANRGRREIEGLIGFFVNTLALRVDLSGAPTVGEVLARVKERALEAQQNQDIPFEQVVELVQPARSLAHTPLFQVMFAWQNASAGKLALPGLTLAPAGAASPHVTARFDLMLSLGEAGGRIAGGVEYATALFEKATVERWLGYLRRVLEAMAADDALGVDRLPMLAESERRRVLREFNDTAHDYPRHACVHDVVETQVERTPDAVAVVFEGERVTYAELNAQANRLAHHLRALGVGPDVRVGICVERSVEMVVGLLGILKAGGAYVPLDSSYPVDRLRFMLEDSAPAVLLTHPPQAATAAALSAESAIPVLDLADAAAWAHQPETNPGREGLGPRNLAHVLFTSGSTGRPKGVMLEHGSLVNRLAWMQDRYGMQPHEALLQKTPFSFDVSFWEFFWPLMVGARLVMARPGGHRDPAYLVETIRREGITVAHFVPSMLQLFLEHPDAETCTGLLRVPVSGEAVSAALVRQFHERLPHVGLFNQYGPTESGEVTEWSCDADAERVSIGRAIHNSTVYVLDRAGEPVPVGVAGELFIGGVAVARGYLGRPRFTAERFVPDPFGEPGERLYRTGDLCRWLESAGVRECVSAEANSGSEDSRTDALTHSRPGVLEYLGRTDFQVKVRGFRVELGEIESRLAVHPGVREAVALALDDGAGGKRLVAYFVGEALESEALRAHLSEQLPEYMVPAAFVRMDAFPVTPNGKLDRRALPAPDADAFDTRAYEAPVGEVEEVLAGIWSELLKVERVGRRDHFFTLGGHSLLAVRVVSRVRQVLGVEAGIGDIFVRPVLADFARGLEAASRAELPAIEPVGRGADLPLSFAQQRLWFIDRLEGAGAAYHIPVRQRLRGELDRVALRRALDRVVARHEALRTTFAEVDGAPVQRIAPVEESAFHLVEHDLRGHPQAGAELRPLMAEEAGAPFDLARGPLIRGRLIQLADDDHVLLITMHHIVSDGWSMGVFTRELNALYAAFRDGNPDPLAPLPIQYADYAVWQRRWVEGEVLREQAAYWQETLAGVPELLELPADHARPARQDLAGGLIGIGLDEGLTAGLKALSRRHGATLFMTLLAGWAAVLARLSGQDDVVIGTPTANRGRSEIEGLIGFFVNTLALRIELGGSPSMAELLARVKARALGAQQHQDIPFEQVVELIQPARSLSHTPLFQVMFTWQNAPEGELELSGLAAPEPAPRPAPAAQAGEAAQTTAKFDLSLAFAERDGRIVGSVVYATALFEQATIEHHLAYLRRALEAMVADASQPVDRLPLLPEHERRRVVEEWNATGRAYPTDGLRVHDLFRAQAARTPHAVALSWRGERLTYAELARRANRVANALRRCGVGPEVRVGICLPRTPELVAAMLGVLGAGGAYVPLDPAYPRERLGYMLEDAGVTLVITESSLADRLPAGAATLLLDVERDAIAAESTAAPEGGVLPENLSHVIFTSGSTGRPKGVMIRHASTVVLLHWLRENVTDEERSSVLFSTSINFDVSVAEIFGTLAWGGKLVIVENALELATIGEDVVHVSMVPSAAAELLRGGGIPASVKTLNLGGEALPSALAQGLYGLRTVRKVGNLYGPTEDTTYSTYYVVPRGADQVRVGTPVANTQAYVLDAHLQPVPAGAVGELYLAGDGLSRGYANRPAMTAERFVPCPFGAPGGRMYRVMDRVRWREESAEVRECVSAEAGSGSADSRTDALTHSRTAVLEYLGRTDFQVKVRGYRIELGEIEARLAEHPGVRAPVVLVREDAPGDRRLVAYYLGDEPVAVDALKAHLSDRVPGYMVPAAYVWMETYPLTPNGKVDRRALPAPEGDAYAAREYAAPVGETEEALAGIWAEVLGVERVGRHESFFELGGHSLLAVRVISRVRQVLGAEVGIADLFQRPVLADLARAIDDAARTELPAIEPVARGADLPLSFAQQRLWFIERLEGAGATYHIPVRQRLRGELDRAALRRALDRMVARHEALRTTFVEVDGAPVQRIAPVEESAFHLVEHDLRGQPQAGVELRRVMADEAGAPFDLEYGPLIRGRLIRLAEDDHLLLLTMHHIVSDGWSMGVLTRELGTLYDAFLHGAPDPLPPLPIQYADYAAWQRQWVGGEVLREQAEYWTQTLAGAPELLELPADHARPARQDFSGGLIGFELGEGLAAGLKALGARHGATLFMTLLASWAAVLSRLSGQDDVVIGTPTANRGRKEIEGLIGFFVNTLAVRVDLSGSPTTAEVLARVKGRALGAQQHQDIPFEQVVELVQPARSLSHTPLFQVMFTWQNAPEGELELSGLAAPEPGPRPGPAPAAPAGAGAAARTTSKFDLSLALAERDGRIAGVVEYAAALFERETVERFAGYLLRALEAMVADESQPVDRLPLLPEAERRRVVEEWNATGRAYRTDGLRVHDLFRAQAARTPHAVALSWRGERLTYAELAGRANRISHALRRRGVGPEVRVGICLPRTPELVAAMLGVLGAGGAYVPLDPAYPRERLGFMLEDAGVTLVITDSTLADRLPEGAATLLLDRDRDAIAAESADAPESGVLPDNLSHVIFTSGSTGRPKGVMIRHASTVVLLHWLRENVTDEERSSVLFSTSINFDVSVAEVFGTLAWGGKLVIVENALELATIGEDVVHVSMVPSAAAELLRGGGIPASVKTLNLGGEALPSALAQGLYALRTVQKVGNLYGPTEDTTYSTYYVVPRGAEQVLVGAPVANTQAYVLDAHLQPMPAGAVGELYLAGEGLSRGYANRPAMTAERFVPCPFGAPGGRMYRVLDRVRWRESAEVRECVSAEVGDSREAANEQRDQPPYTPALEYLGRTDFQVKVRGYRIELGEIEARLAEHPGVRAPVVLVREDAPGDRRLVAYYLGDEPAAVEALKAHLSDRLPGYMVPSAYVWMETYPLTPNGKMDRRALPAPEGNAYAAREYAAPAGETEEALAGIWAKVLGVERVGRHDNFFELGGHSLLAVRVISRMRQVLGVEAPLAHLFSHPTVESLAARVSGAGDGDGHPGDRAIAIRPSGSQPPLFLVHEGAGSIAYAQVLHPHVGDDIPVYALPAAPADAPLRSVEGMATRLVRMIREVQPSGPYRVAGWSFGGVLAYEVAQQLIGRDESVEFVGMFDSYHPARARAVPHDVAQEHALLLHVLRMAEAVESNGRVDPDDWGVAAGDVDLETFVTRCRAQGLLPGHVTVEDARRMRERLRSHQRALHDYAPQPLPVPVHLFPARESGDPDPSRGWLATLSATQLRITPVPGTHLSMMQAPNAATLGAALSRAVGRAAPAALLAEDRAPREG